MKEAFRYARYSPQQKAILESVDAAFYSLSTPGRGVTTLQIYWYLVRVGLIEHSYNARIEFQTLVTRGLYGGQLDWDIRPDRVLPPVMRESDGPVELWARTFAMGSWMIEAAEYHDLTLVLECKYKFTSQSYWMAMDRLSHFIEREPVTILYMSDGKINKERTFFRVRDEVRHMLKIRLSRGIFNGLVGRPLWSPEGAHLAANPDEYEHIVDRAQDEAEKLLIKNFRAVNIGLSPDNCQYVDSGLHCLQMLDPKNLKHVLSSAVSQSRKPRNASNTDNTDST